MKQLLYIAFIITSLTGFSQEKKGVCSASVHLFHDNGEDYNSNDHFYLEGFSFNNPLYYGNFQIDSTALPDSLIYEIILPFGDSLLYSAGWIADGMCYNVDTAVVNHIVTVLEGIPFPITYTGYYFPLYFNLSQTGVITNECFFRIRKDHTYFIRVKFQDPSIPETPLDLPEITNDISLWLSSENRLTIKTDENVVWDMDLYSLSGQVIQKVTLEGSQNLDVSNLPKGCYIARVSNENGLGKQLKFIR